MKSEIDRAPDAACDDSDSAAFYAMRILSVGSYAAEAWSASDPITCARWASDECLGFVRDLEWGAERHSHSLVALEAAEQRRVLARVRRGDEAVLDASRRDGQLDAAPLTLAEDYLRRRGWTTC